MEALQNAFQQIAKFVTRKVKSYRRANEFDLLGSSSSSSSSGRSGNGVSISVVNRSVVLSLLWLFLSFCAVIYGFRDCSYNSYSYKLVCKGGSCIYTASTREGVFNKKIDRTDMRRVDTVRLGKNGEVIDFSDGSRRSTKKLGEANPSLSARSSVDNTLIFFLLPMSYNEYGTINFQVTLFS